MGNERTLYEIREDYLDKLNNLNVNEDGEVIGIEEIEQLEGDLKEKIKAVVFFIEEQTALEKAIKEKIESQKKRLEAIGKTRDRLKEYVAYTLLSTGIIDEKHKKYETEDFALSVRASEETVIVDKSQIPHELCKLKVVEPTYEPDKTLIKEAIKSGVIVPGATVRSKQNLQIK